MSLIYWNFSTLNNSWGITTFGWMWICLLTHYSAAMPFGNRILEDLFSSVLSKFKKYHLSGNLKFNNLGIFQSLKLRNLMRKIIPIPFKLNFTPNTLGCYGLSLRFFPFSSNFLRWKKSSLNGIAEANENCTVEKFLWQRTRSDRNLLTIANSKPMWLRNRSFYVTSAQ